MARGLWLWVGLISAGCAAQGVERAPEPEAYAGATACEPLGLGRDTTLAEAVTGVVAEPVRIDLVVCADEGWSYAFQTEDQRGEGFVSFVVVPFVLLADLDSDGDADLWFAGFPDGQGRVYTSDVWLFDEDRAAYVFASAFSALPNLELSPSAKVLQSGSTCGCGASCWFVDRYVIENHAPVHANGIRQECESDGGLLYQEYERREGAVVVAFESRADHPSGVDYDRGMWEPVDLVSPISPRYSLASPPVTASQ